MSITYNKALQKMIENRKQHKFDAKSQALEWFTAKKNKKKLPVFKRREEKPSEYKKMSMDDYINKYGI